MAYTEKFQTLSDNAIARVNAVEPSQVDKLVPIEPFYLIFVIKKNMTRLTLKAL